MDEIQLQEPVVLYDEEPDIFWDYLDFVICKDNIYENEDDEYAMLAVYDQPIFFLPR